MALTKINSSLISNNTVANTNIADNAVDATKIASNSILTRHIDDNQITADQIAANTIATGNVADNAIDGTKIASNSILTRHIDDDQVTADQIAANTIATANVADNAIDGTKIASNSILTRHIDDDQITGAQLADNIDIVGTLDVTGATVLDSTLAVAGDLTANAGVVVDNFTLDGTTLALSSGDITLDAAGDVILDAGGDDIKINSGGTLVHTISNNSGAISFVNAINNKSILFKGVDADSAITALELDMQNAGFGTFASGIKIDGGVSLFKSTGGGTELPLKVTDANDNMVFQVQGGGAAHFNYGPVAIGTTEADEATLLVRATTEIATGGNYNDFGNLHVSTNTQGINNGGTISMGGLGRTSGPTEYFRYAQISGRAESGSNGTPQGYMAFETTSGVTNLTTERMRISSGGGVAIGTTSTGTRSLSVSQLATSDACILASSGNSDVTNNAALLQCQFQGDATPATGSKFILFVNQSAVMGSVTAANASTVAFNASSDERLKENIVDASSQLQTILNTKVREFDWKNNGVHNLGFIAQELNEFIPDVVQEGGDDETKNPWQVDYGKLTPYLVKAIQEQQTLIEDLKTRIETLEG